MQANKETGIYARRTFKMFSLVRDLYLEGNSSALVQKFSRIEKYENISDRMEVEIAKYLTKVLDGRLSDKSKFEIQTLLRVVSEIESVADGCYNIARTIIRKNDDKAAYTEDMDNNINRMMDLVESAMGQMEASLQSPNLSSDDFNRSVNLESEINNFRNRLKNQNISDLKSKRYNYQASVTYMDIIVECERTGDYIINVSEALKEASVKNN
jgi:phosphate:Na+ symporter